MRLRKIIQDYFTFSKKERNGIIVLLVFVILIATANRLIFLFEKPGDADVAKFIAEIEAFEKQQNIAETRDAKALFNFDPNTIDSIAMDSLWLPIYVKKNILKFRNKGGKFYNPADLRKIYGMNDSVFAMVEAYIRIKSRYEKPDTQKPVSPRIKFHAFDPNKMSEVEWMKLGLSSKQAKQIERFRNSVGGRFESAEQFSKTYGIKPELMDSFVKYIQIQPFDDFEMKTPGIRREIIELNSADSILLKCLPGIGDVLSKRIIKYRNLLGGFYSTKQLAEVYGIKPELLCQIENRLKVDTLAVKLMNVNFSSYEELSNHPYIGKRIGREIINYRSKNGEITNLSVFLKERIVNIKEYEKLKHYIRTKK